MEKELIYQEKWPQKVKRAAKIITILKDNYPDLKSNLNYQNAFELFVAVPLSAQTTDENVNKVTKKLFKLAPTPEKLAALPLETLEETLYSVGFYKQKARNLQKAAVKLVTEYDCKVPASLTELLKFPGIARKSANIILTEGFGKVVGIAVDTHVKRVSLRLYFTTNTNPDKIEQQLLELIDKQEWGIINHLLIAHGRAICQAKKPDCANCPVRGYCPSRGQ
jgi:endonuclease-3